MPTAVEAFRSNESHSCAHRALVRRRRSLLLSEGLLERRAATHETGHHRLLRGSDTRLHAGDEASGVVTKVMKNVTAAERWPPLMDVTAQSYSGRHSGHTKAPEVPAMKADRILKRTEADAADRVLRIVGDVGILGPLGRRARFFLAA